MRRTSHPRGGFALATALLTLGLIGALVTGTFFIAVQEQRTGTGILATARALAAAELALGQVMASWDREWNVVMRRGDRRGGPPTDSEGASATSQVVRLDNQIFLVSSEGHAGLARRIVRRYVALTVPEPMLGAAFTLGGPVAMDGATAIDGEDLSPDGWTCPESGPPVAGIAVADSALILTNGCSAGPCVTGNPSISADSTLRDPGQLMSPGGIDRNELVLRANATLEGMVSPHTSERDSACDIEDQHNWGDPVRAGVGVCTNHFILAHAPGDLTIDGGVGQGLLLVDGNLTIAGGFDFAGLVLVGGALQTGPGGARITGALVVAGADSSQVSSLRDLVVNFSRCAVHAAMLGTALPTPITERSWFEVVDGR